MMNTIDRMAQYVVETSSECTQWTGGKDKDGYPIFWYEGKTRHAARVLWELLNGSIPKDLIIRHTCDTPECLEPSHLTLGTHKDNTRDMIIRQRDGGFNRKITADAVKQINAMRFEGRSIKYISQYLKVSVSTLYNYIKTENKRQGAYIKGKEHWSYSGGHQQPSIPRDY